MIWYGWNWLGALIRSSSRRASFRAYGSPLALLALVVFWVVLFVFGFGFVMWGLALPLNAPDKGINFLTYLYLSGTTFSRSAWGMSL